MSRGKASIFVSILVAAGLLLGACAPTTTPAASTQAPANTAAPAAPKLSGEIIIDGSSTVFPISEKMSDEFTNAYPDVQIPVGESGTGGGFKKFCNGETDISDASRPIKDAEKQACADSGVEYVELKVGNDGLAVVVNPDVDFVDCLTFAQLKTMWAPEAEGVVASWDKVDARFPARALSLFGPGTDSGTYDFFNETVLGTNQDGKVITPRTDYQPSEDDNVLVQGVSGEPGALGYFGLAYFENNKGKLKDLAVDKKGDGTCVRPTAETVLDGSYPLARPLFIYVSEDSLQRPEVSAFVKFYLENAKEYTAAVGYVPLPDADYAKAMENYLAATAR